MSPTSKSIEQLSAGLGAEDPAERLAAAEELSARRDPETIALLARAASDFDRQVSDAAVQGLAGFPASVMLPRLEEFLRNGEDARLRSLALELIPAYGEKAEPFLFRLLHDEDPGIRLFAGQLLAQVRDHAAVDRLVAALADPDINVRHSAAEALGAIRDPRAAHALIPLLQDDFWVSYAAAAALGEIGDPSAIDPLLDLLDRDDLVAAAVEALGKIGDATAIPALAGLLSGRRPEVRQDAIGALVRIQARIDRHIVPDGQCLPSIRRALQAENLADYLIASLDSDDLELRRNAVIALGWLKSPEASARLVPLLADFDLEEFAIAALASIGEPAVPELLAALSDPDPRARVSIVRCLGWMEHPAGPLACLDSLADPHPEVRQQAVLALGAVVEKPEAEDALFEALLDAEPEVRSAAVDTIARSRSRRLPDRLRAMLDSEPRTMLAAAAVQQRLRAPGMVDALARALADNDPELRAASCLALAACPEARAAQAHLLRALHDGHPRVRRAAAEALSGLRREEVELHLLPLLQDPDDEVRLAALQSLGRLGSAASVDYLLQAFESGNRQFQLNVIKTLGAIPGPPSRNFLAGLLLGSSPDLKNAAIEALSRQADPRVSPHLVIALDDPNWSVRHAAVRALGSLGNRRAAQPLIERLTDPEEIVRKEAVIALGRLGAQEAVSRLLPLLTDPYLQPEAVEAVARLGITDLDSLEDFFRQADTRTRGIILETIARMPDPRLLPCLLQGATDECPAVRVRAVRGLAERHDPAALPALLNAQRHDPSPEVRQEAVAALRRMEPAP